MTEKTLHVVGDGVDLLTAATLLLLWQQHVAGERAPLTLRRYSGALRQFLEWYAREEGRALALSDLHPITLAGYRGVLQQTAATSTVNTHVCALRAWGAWLHAQGYLPTNPAARLKLVGRTEPAAPRALSPAQVNALLRAAQRTRYPARNTQHGDPADVGADGPAHRRVRRAALGRHRFQRETRPRAGPRRQGQQSAGRATQRFGAPGAGGVPRVAAAGRTDFKGCGRRMARDAEWTPPYASS